MNKIVMENSHLKAAEIVDKLTRALSTFQGNLAAEDDFTCVIIKTSSPDKDLGGKSGKIGPEKVH